MNDVRIYEISSWWWWLFYHIGDGLIYPSTGLDRNPKSKYILSYNSSWLPYFCFHAHLIFCFVRPDSVHLSMRFTKLEMAHDCHTVHCSRFNVVDARVHRSKKTKWNLCYDYELFYFANEPKWILCMSNSVEWCFCSVRFRIFSKHWITFCHVEFDSIQFSRRYVNTYSWIKCGNASLCHLRIGSCCRTVGMSTTHRMCCKLKVNLAINQNCLPVNTE